MGDSNCGYQGKKLRGNNHQLWGRKGKQRAEFKCNLATKITNDEDVRRPDTCIFQEIKQENLISIAKNVEKTIHFNEKT
jgi:hypothetical protein